MTNTTSRLRIVRALTDKYLLGDNDVYESGGEEKEHGVGLVAEGDTPTTNDLAA